jgi:anti-sigma factor (TIGR02949 family)
MIANCRTTLSRLGDLLDGALAPVQAETLRGHLAVCPRCTEFLAAYRAVGGIVERATAADLPDNLAAQVLRRLGLARAGDA